MSASVTVTPSSTARPACRRWSMIRSSVVDASDWRCVSIALSWVWACVSVSWPATDAVRTRRSASSSRRDSML